jgi:glycosyltransferase involved in cell wall biosynthesis
MKISVVYHEGGAPVDGIRDYSHELCAALTSSGAEASFDPIGRGELPPEVAQADAVVLQYNPFSYGRRGYAPWLPSELKRLKSVHPRPILAVMVHEPYMPLDSVRTSLMGGWQRLQLAKMRRSVDVTFVSIEPWCETVARWGPKGRIHHVPVGSNLPDLRDHREGARADLGATEETIVLTAFGTGHPSRLSQHLSASATALVEGGHSVVLNNLGAGALEPKGVPESVRIETPGRLDVAALAHRLSATDVFVAPFVDGVSSRRGTFVAALQHGLPIVGTVGPLTDQFLRHEVGAFRLIPVDDGNRFGDTVLELADQPRERESLARGARGLYERQFAWPVIADRILMHLRRTFLEHLSEP